LVTGLCVFPPAISSPSAASLSHTNLAQIEPGTPLPASDVTEPEALITHKHLYDTGHGLIQSFRHLLPGIWPEGLICLSEETHKTAA